jgi:hypothetical protein
MRLYEAEIASSASQAVIKRRPDAQAADSLPASLKKTPVKLPAVFY